MEHQLISARDDLSLHIAGTGAGPDVVVLSGGPGCVHYLADERLAPEGVRAWSTDPARWVDVVTRACQRANG